MIQIEWRNWKDLAGGNVGRIEPMFNNHALQSVSEEERRKQTDSAEMSTLRWARGKTKLDHIRNDDIVRTRTANP